MVAKPGSVNRLLATLGLAAVLALPVAACAPAVPDNPTYTKDVQPILAAHCVRCHGAGGALHMISTVPTTLSHQIPQLCYLQSYDNIPAGCTIGSANCQAGAAFCSGMFMTVLDPEATLAMPPKPSDSLVEWEKETLLRWASITPPPK